MSKRIALRNLAFFPLAASVILAAGGCMPVKPVRTAAVALTVQDVAAAASRQSNLLVVKEGTPAYIMLVDGLIEAYPNNKDLLIAGCQAYSSYASSFIPDNEPGKAEPLYRQAKEYGFRALSSRADFSAAASGNLDDFKTFLSRYRRKDVPELFWTASAWASWVACKPGDVNAMGDLPALEALMRRILELDDSFYHGSPHLLMAVFLAAKPAVMGGDPARAKQHFERAFSLGGGRLLISRVYYAQYYLRAVGDRDLFRATLEEVLNTPADQVPELTLANTIAREKARRLLDNMEVYFENTP